MLTVALGAPFTSAPAPEVSLTFDDEGSPWHTLCTAEGPDRRGLLHALTTAFATSGASVHAARVATVEGRVTDVFELTDAHGRKLDEGAKDRVRRALAQGTGARRTTRQRLRRAWPGKSHTIETFERPF